MSPWSEIAGKISITKGIEVHKESQILVFLQTPIGERAPSPYEWHRRFRAASPSPFSLDLVSKPGPRRNWCLLFRARRARTLANECELDVAAGLNCRSNSDGAKTAARDDKNLVRLLVAIIVENANYRTKTNRHP